MSEKHHGGNLKNSERLNRIWGLLRGLNKGEYLSTASIQRYTGSMATSTDIADLRKNGKVIDCKFLRITDTGRKIYGYRIAS